MMDHAITIGDLLYWGMAVIIILGVFAGFIWLSAAFGSGGFIIMERDKVSKRAVNYRPKTGVNRCGNCAMLHGRACDLVEGDIDPQYTCDKWLKKE